MIGGSFNSECVRGTGDTKPLPALVLLLEAAADAEAAGCRVTPMEATAAEGNDAADAPSTAEGESRDTGGRAGRRKAMLGEAAVPLGLPDRVPGALALEGLGVGD